MSKVVAVIGTSRGIGRELVLQLSKSPNTTVIGSTRSETKAEPVGSNIVPIVLDITDDESIAAAARSVPELDVLIINAVIGLDDHLLSLPAKHFLTYLNTNVVGPSRIIQAFYHSLLARSTRQIILVSSIAGSLQLQKGETFGLQGPYAVTKAAANMVAIQWHNELHHQGFTVIPLHPGWVATEMGNLGGSGGMSVNESAKAVLNVIGKLKPEDSAKFFSYDGSTLPW